MPTTILDKVIISASEETTAKPILVYNPVTKRVHWQTSPIPRIEALEAKLDSDNNFKTIPNPDHTFNATTRVLTMAAGWVGTINGVDYTNVAEVPLAAIPLAAINYSRIDLIVFNAAGTFVRIPGIESTRTPIKPSKPVNTLEATFITVSSAVVHVAVTPKPKAPVTSVNGMRGDVIIPIGMTTIITTVKPILSTALLTQNVAGFVNYINALNPVVVVASNEIVKYSITDTGRIFELNLRGRSFGIGQPAIVAANVLEATEFMNKDIQLSNYPSTRNDGASPTNRILGTDATGKLKMFSIPLMPAPYLLVLVPDSTLPSTTTNFVLKGAFFTPTMTVSIVGQTINYITFVSDNEVRVNVTTGATEGMFAVILNNGIEKVFNDALMIVLGDVFTPTSLDWEAISGTANYSVAGEASIVTFGTEGQATYNKIFNATKKYSVYLSVQGSPFHVYITYNEGSDYYYFIDQVTGDIREFRYYFSGPYYGLLFLKLNGVDVGTYTSYEKQPNGFPLDIKFTFLSTNLLVYLNGVLKWSLPPIVNNQKLTIKTKYYDLKKIKYVEHFT